MLAVGHLKDLREQVKLTSIIPLYLLIIPKNDSVWQPGGSSARPPTNCQSILDILPYLCVREVLTEGIYRGNFLQHDYYQVVVLREVKQLRMSKFPVQLYPSVSCFQPWSISRFPKTSSPFVLESKTKSCLAFFLVHVFFFYFFKSIFLFMNCLCPKTASALNASKIVVFKYFKIKKKKSSAD